MPPWALQITLEDKPVRASDSADDINVCVALSTALLLLGDFDQNAKLSEYENYALMLQRSVQHAHSFSIQSFENRKELADKKREVASLQKANKSLQSKMKTLEDQAEAAIKAQNVAKENAESAEAIKKVLESEKREAEEKMTQAKKELQEALATKETEVKAADEKGYNEGEAAGTKSLSLNEQVLDLTQDEKGEEVPKDATPEKPLSDMPLAERSLDLTLQEIDAELAAKKAAEMSSQQSSEVQT
ncbi:dynactin subunit 1-like [Camellia sinensis]|uniref:dynactin subunit 1-like n=1 Tax=Camellia sinensis TaxID=4442 RepID=UPI0010362EC5|nr:dynactin subunit 1-like [Camellia sinensis]